MKKNFYCYLFCILFYTTVSITTPIQQAYGYLQAAERGGTEAAYRQALNNINGVLGNYPSDRNFVLLGLQYSAKNESSEDLSDEDYNNLESDINDIMKTRIGQEQIEILDIVHAGIRKPLQDIKALNTQTEAILTAREEDRKNIRALEDKIRNTCSEKTNNQDEYNSCLTNN